MNKKSLLYILLDLIFLAVFNTVFFVVGRTEHPASVWIAYGFIHFSYIMVLVTPFLVRKNSNAAVFGFALYSVSATYFFIEFVVGLIFVFVKSESYKASLVVQIIIAGVYAIMLIQKRILAAYEQDFSKHAPNEIVPRLRMLWNSIPSQLAKENKKFIYGLVREGARAKDYETAIMWLSDCGLVHKVSRVNAAGIPLRAYEDLKAFKLFVVDVGLLGCMAGLRQRTLLDGNDLFVEFKGALTEQYVCQQLKTIEDLDVYYYTNERVSCEVDFVVDTGEQIVPVEVKAEVNLRAKSLKTYQEKFSPEISIRTSMSDYKKEEWLVNLPLYVSTTLNIYADVTRELKKKEFVGLDMYFMEKE